MQIAINRIAGNIAKAHGDERGIVVPMTYTYETISTEIKHKVLYATIGNPPINLIDQPFVRDLVGLLGELDTTRTCGWWCSAAPTRNSSSRTSISAHRRVHGGGCALGGPDDVEPRRCRPVAAAERRLPPSPFWRAGPRAGHEFALATDMRFASRERAVITQPEAAFGVFPGAGAVQHITRLVGRGNEMQVLLASGGLWRADEAERIGLVNRSLPDADLLPYVTTLAERIANFPEGSVRLIKRRINAVALPPREDVQVDGSMLAVLARDPEVVKRMRFFMPRGLQTRFRTELELGEALAEYTEEPAAQ